VLPPPPPSLRVEATARETRILLDHGRPRPPVRGWERLAVAAWVVSMLLSWLFPILFCPLGLTATLGLATAVVIDLARTVVDRVVLRADQLRLVHRSSFGRTSTVVPWSALSSVLLESEERGPRSRDALLLRWEEEGNPRWARVGLGREAADLAWIRELLAAVQARLARIEAGVSLTPQDEVIGEVAQAVDADGATGGEDPPIEPAPP
jgi:hypothetical protein